MKTFSLVDLPLENKTVLVRVDYNVPLKNRRVLDNLKIKSSLSTIKYLLQKNCKIILATHLGRPLGKQVSELRTDPLVKELKKLLPKVKITKFDDCIGKEVRKKIKNANKKQIFLLENLRFYPEEKENDSFFAHSLADLADFYVNNAFAVSHRKDASLDAITHYLPAAVGTLFKKEMHHLSLALKPKHPFIWLIGGAKIDKIDLIKQALEKADRVLIGGALAFSFLKAKGFQVGMSKIDTNSVKLAKKILRKKINRKKIILPLDVVTAPRSKSKNISVCSISKIPSDQVGFDIGPKTIRLFSQYIVRAKTIIWNGPLGYFEVKPFHKSTQKIAKIIVSESKALSVIGGGETSAAIHKLKLASKFTHVSTAGGAALTFMTTGSLVGITALEKNYKKFKKKFR